MDRWLQMVASNSYILRMQSMYQFLCIDANLPPPYLEIHWRDSANGSFEEMDMEEMFDGRDDEMNEDDEDDEDEEEEDDEDEDEDDEEFDVDIDDVPAAEQKPAQSVFGFGDNAAASPLEKKKRTASKGGDKAQGKNKRTTGQEANLHHHHQQGQAASQYAVNRHAKESHGAAEMEDENDGLDIQSLSVVEAEFIYNKIDEGKTQGVIEKKRTINLEAFKIIRVIGKGNEAPPLVYIKVNKLIAFVSHTHREFRESVFGAR